jgi:hypothetical protein
MQIVRPLLKFPRPLDFVRPTIFFVKAQKLMQRGAIGILERRREMQVTNAD